MLVVSRILLLFVLWIPLQDNATVAPAVPTVTEGIPHKVCPTCGAPACVIKIEEEHDPKPWFQDNCGMWHCHDSSSRTTSFECDKGHRFSEEESLMNGRCACGWPDYPNGVFYDVCDPRDGAYEWVDRPY